jgi:hypothetical protein
MPFRWRNTKGVIDVPVVHCTYFIRNDILSDISYDDNSGRYEYVIFSDVLRKKGIPQYLDNRMEYGFLTFAITPEELEKDCSHELLTKYKSIINGKEDSQINSQAP